MPTYVSPGSFPGFTVITDMDLSFLVSYKTIYSQIEEGMQSLNSTMSPHIDIQFS